jgi:DNA-binding XRE family transcriptional regulator
LSATPAEHRTLREDCGLSLRECARWHQVSERTINLWESPSKGGPPPKAAIALAIFRAHLAEYAKNLTDQLLTSARTGESIELERYTALDYPRTELALLGLPHGGHNRMVSIAADMLIERGYYPTIVYHGIGDNEPRADEAVDDDPADQSHSEITSA